MLLLRTDTVRMAEKNSESGTFAKRTLSITAVSMRYRIRGQEVSPQNRNDVDNSSAGRSSGL